ncbi:UbiA family prenyltransferase [Tengunoibacter tsumagoiensis]|uniref:Ubiquinone biosynthesis protein UbiA n=1 Tax=Tengunoibacter tsumagoiensis TaxID=2014871 RepID=A0A402A5H3_9CHLR|nr:UbiA family prenyltransferase [Tengunoibacter tsumagoiensis]GCE14350.1 hypothetical protein KTT_42090 [Tengunoibacter tsumagoiensis]
MVKKRTPVEVLYGFFLLCHPLPVFFHAVAVSLFAFMAGWPVFRWGTLALVISAHVAMQIAIAIFNDYCDRHLDAQSRSDKPIVRGWIRPSEAFLGGLFFCGLMILLLLPLNRLALLISLCYLTLGLSYNIGLKATLWSGIVFAVAIPLIPLYAFVGMDVWHPFVFWLVPVAALVGIALNLSNSLPDIEDDASHHTRTLAVVLGPDRTLLLTPTCLLCATAIIAILTMWQVVATRGLITQLTLLEIGLLGVGLLVSWRYWLDEKRRKLYFYLIVSGCFLLVGGWLIGILS